MERWLHDKPHNVCICEGCMSLKLPVILSFTMHFFCVCVSCRLCCSSIQTVPAADQTDETFCRWILKRKRPKVSVAAFIGAEKTEYARFVSVWGVRKKIYPCFEWLEGRKIGKLNIVYSVCVDNKENIFFFWHEKNWINTFKSIILVGQWLG